MRTIDTYTLLDIDTWNRKDQFRFFKTFDEPFFGVTVQVDCTTAYQKAKAKGVSFFLYYLHKCLLAANAIDGFKYRINGEEVRVFEQVHASATINRPNGTFGFSYMNFDPSFEIFEKDAQLEIERVQASEGLEPALSGENVIHISSLPWINFTSLSHARTFSFPDSCPKISFGKMTNQGEQKVMPVSIHVHHALMDGIHVGQFIEGFQEALDT